MFPPVALLTAEPLSFTSGLSFGLRPLPPDHCLVQDFSLLVDEVVHVHPSVLVVRHDSPFKVCTFENHSLSILELILRI